MKKNSNKVIEGGTLIDGTGQDPRENVLIIKGNKIKVVGKKGEVRYPPNAEIITAKVNSSFPV